MSNRKMWVCEKCARGLKLVSIVPDGFVSFEPCEQCGDFYTAHTDFLTTKTLLTN